MVNTSPGWELYRSFLAVVREGSLSGGARLLGLTQPTVGRHIDALEASLGAGLFTRSQGGLTPTELALARAAGGLAHAVRRADRYERADGRVSHAFEVTLAARDACLPRSKADIVRQTVEAEIEALLNVKLRTEKTGRLVSKPLPWPES